MAKILQYLFGFLALVVAICGTWVVLVKTTTWVASDFMMLEFAFIVFAAICEKFADKN